MKRQTDFANDSSIEEKQREMLEQLSQQAAHLNDALAKFTALNPHLQVAQSAEGLMNGDEIIRADQLTEITPELAKLALGLYRVRRKREDHLDKEIMGEAGWDILLDIYARQSEGKTVSITSACIGSAVPSTTALRWVSILVDRGLLTRHEDPEDKRRAFLTLTKHGIMAMNKTLRDAAKTLRVVSPSARQKWVA
ncbi:hypothetical protein [Novosphingobium sp. BL-52-GroH]|uniref:hypothetical protein n=1 Tax=Novosphingobium sp. BL-52-GroH TaxID=3349877 RepID=UPI00384C2560